MMRSFLLALSLATLALAGCVEPADESRDPTLGAGCASRYVTIHYDGVDDRDRLRDALESAGFAWRDNATDADTGAELPTGDVLSGQQGVAELDPPGDDVDGVVSYDPGTSSVPDAQFNRTIVLSFEEASPSSDPAQVPRVAQAAANVVNQTFEDARVVLWAEDAHTAACGEPGGIPAGPRAG